jgi:hypothetical protein
MIMIGCDYHPGFQQIAYVNTDTGELSEAPGSQGTGRAVLPRTQEARPEGAGGHGSQWTCALVRFTVEAWFLSLKDKPLAFRFGSLQRVSEEG